MSSVRSQGVLRHDYVLDWRVQEVKGLCQGTLIPGEML